MQQRSLRNSKNEATKHAGFFIFRLDKPLQPPAKDIFSTNRPAVIPHLFYCQMCELCCLFLQSRSVLYTDFTQLYHMEIYNPCFEEYNSFMCYFKASFPALYNKYETYINMGRQGNSNVTISGEIIPQSDAHTILSIIVSRHYTCLVN